MGRTRGAESHDESARQKSPARRPTDQPWDFSSDPALREALIDALAAALVPYRRLQLRRPLGHPQLEIVIEPGDLGLRLRELRRLDHFPAAPTLGNGELVGARHVEELTRAARREWIRAEHRHG